MYLLQVQFAVVKAAHGDMGTPEEFCRLKPCDSSVFLLFVSVLNMLADIFSGIHSANRHVTDLSVFFLLTHLNWGIKDAS